MLNKTAHVMMFMRERITERSAADWLVEDGIGEKIE